MTPDVAAEARKYLTDTLPGIPSNQGLRSSVFTDGSRGRQRMPLHLPPEEPLRDTCHAVESFLAVSLAREVALLFFANMMLLDPETGVPDTEFDTGGFREVALVGHWYPGGEHMTYAFVDRYARPPDPVIGDWRVLEAEVEIVDALGASVRAGLSSVLRLGLPENADLRARLDDIWAEDDAMSVIPHTYQALKTRGWLS